MTIHFEDLFFIWKRTGSVLIVTTKTGTPTGSLNTVLHQTAKRLKYARVLTLRIEHFLSDRLPCRAAKGGVSYGVRGWTCKVTGPWWVEVWVKSGCVWDTDDRRSGDASLISYFTSEARDHCVPIRLLCLWPLMLYTVVDPTPRKFYVPETLLPGTPDGPPEPFPKQFLHRKLEWELFPHTRIDDSPFSSEGLSLLSRPTQTLSRLSRHTNLTPTPHPYSPNLKVRLPLTSCLVWWPEPRCTYHLSVVKKFVPITRIRSKVS